MVLLVLAVVAVVGATVTTDVTVDATLPLLLGSELSVVGTTATTTVLVVVAGVVNGEPREVDVELGVVTVTPPLAPGPLIKAADAETQSKSEQP